MTKEKIQEAVTKIIPVNNDFLKGDEFLTLDEKNWRKKIKNRLKNLCSAVTSIFRHIKDIKKDMEDLTEAILENSIELEQHQKSIDDMVDALDAYGLATETIKKGKAITPVEKINEYPNTWDYYGDRKDRNLFPLKVLDTKEHKNEHYCVDCKFSQISSAGASGHYYECKYTKSAFFQNVIKTDALIVCKDFVSDYGHYEPAAKKTIMIVDLSGEPEVSSYEI
jgi:hypothetical protein